MANSKCEVCNEEIDKSHKARHIKSAKHIRNLNNIQHQEEQQEEQQNEVFNFDDTLFEPNVKTKKYKCKIYRFKVDDLDKHKKSFSHEKS
jgi:hypothetical protein